MTESELQLLRALTEKNDLLRRVTVSPDQFSTPEGQRIARWYVARIKAGKGVSTTSLIELHHAGKISKQMVEALALDPDYWVSAHDWSVDSYCADIHQAWLGRRLREAIADTKGMDPAEAVQSLVSQLRTLSTDSGAGEAVRLYDLVAEQYKRLDDDVPEKVVPTGIAALDEKMDGGLRAGEYILLAGRPSMGKSTLARQIATAAASGCPVLFVSAEDTAETFALRAMASASNVGLGALRRRKLEDHEWMAVGTSVGEMAKLDLHVYSGSRITIPRVEAVAAKQEWGLVVVDYIGMLASRRDRVEAIGEASKALKDLAKDLHCPLIAVSQLNRDLERRPNKRPILADLRDSGDLEQDADAVLFVYRDEVYDPASKDKGFAEIGIAKQRNGPAGPSVYVKISCDLTKGRFG